MPNQPHGWSVNAGASGILTAVPPAQGDAPASWIKTDGGSLVDGTGVLLGAVRDGGLWGTSPSRLLGLSGMDELSGLGQSFATKDTATVFSGDAAMRYTFAAGGLAGDYQGIITNDPVKGTFCVPLRPGVPYTLKIASRVSSFGNGESYRITLNHNGLRTSVSQKVVAYRAATTWQLDEYTFTVPTTAEPNAELLIEFTRGSTNATDFWVDSLRIDELEVKEIFDNGLKSGNFTIDWTNGPRQKVQLGASSLVLSFANPQPGQRYILIMQQDATGSRTVPTFSDTVMWPADTPPTLSTTPGTADLFEFWYTATPTSRYHGFTSALNVMLPVPQVQIVQPTSMASSTTHNVGMPATVNASDLLVMFFSRSGTSAITNPTGWTRKDQGVSADRTRVYIKVADGTEGGTNVNVATGVAESAAAQVYRITKWFGTTAGVECSSNTAGGPSTAPDPPLLTPTWGSERDLWLEMEGAAANPTVTASANYTNVTATNDTGAACQVGSARRTLYATSENPGTMTLGSSQSWDAHTVAVRPPA